MKSRVLTQFGLADQSAEYWINQNPALQFIGIRQTHSNRLVEVVNVDVKNNLPWPWPSKETSVPDADALMTSQKNVALVIITADCLPILIHDPIQNRIAACHAGWRGVENRILPKTLSALIEKGGDASTFQIWIGPHIQAENFEVGLDVARTLVASVKGGEAALRAHTDSTKVHVDLNSLITLQAAESKVSEHQLHYDPRNTYLDSRLSSFRREGPLSGRMLSWITLLT